MYEDLCSTRPLTKFAAAVMELEVLPSDLTSEVYCVHWAKRPLELENPEWPVLARRAKLVFIASALSDVDNRQRFLLPLPFENEDDFTLSTFVEDALLLNDGREVNGQGEFLISCAFAANEAVRVRGLDGGYWGPLYAFRRFFRSPGALLREIWMAALLWLIAIGLVMLPCLWYRGPAYWLLSVSFILVGLAGAWASKDSTESWLDEGFEGALPGDYPVRMQRRPRRYAAYKGGDRSPALLFSAPFFLRLLRPREGLIGGRSLEESEDDDCYPMRLASFLETVSLLMLWSLLSFFFLDEEPVFDFSD